MCVDRGLGFTMCGFPSRVTMVLRGVKDTGRTIDLQKDRTSMMNLQTGAMRGGHEINCENPTTYI